MKGFAQEKNRIEKARKIEAVLSDFLGGKIRNKRILDIGTGRGLISEYFSRTNKVYAVDIVDQRKNKKSSIIFEKVYSEKLPFRDNCFDVVISNHVIEHLPNQQTHVEEIRRVLKNNGVCYLATPNRLFPREPHYTTFLMHYLPQTVFTYILKTFQRHKENVNLLSYFKLRRLISNNFLFFEEYTDKIAKNPERFRFQAPIINLLPLPLLKKFNFISPTNVFVLRK